MTRFPFSNSMDGFVASRINWKRINLEEKSDEFLEEIVGKGLLCADNMDAVRNPFGYWSLTAVPSEFYEGIAAAELLKERHGNDYVLDLLGYRKPKGFYEKFRYFFTGNFPLKS